jgi:sec-independent protein translocase protein TatA
MPTLGPLELAIIAFIIILIFGVGRLPELGGALGKSIREFRKSTAEFTAATSGAEPGVGGSGADSIEH